MDRQHWPWLVAGTGLWTFALGLAIYASAERSWLPAFWALITAQGACLATGLIIVDLALARHQGRVERIAVVAARAVLSDRDLPHLPTS